MLLLLGTRVRLILDLLLHLLLLADDDQRHFIIAKAFYASRVSLRKRFSLSYGMMSIISPC